MNYNTCMDTLKPELSHTLILLSYVINEISSATLTHCTYEGRTYLPGEVHLTPCVTCQCQIDGALICETTSCDGRMKDCIFTEHLHGEVSKS